ncbi:phosphatase PAP2 family protein [Candidatus Peregrinibacteria bacterium]|jgi:membrane-associated phospholipid phosphatase|nr:phosphatase PAP2 family protein [Candidatus Peregrinibacteria bacterium]MBT4055734.1 phosphatase PAP2 family protein [Candidatus Peregrinibacteria bacterium]
MKKVSVRFKYLFGIFLLIQIQFKLVEYFSELRPESYLSMWVDQYIPFWAHAIWIYIFVYYVVWIFSFFGIKNLDIVRKGVNALLYGVLITAPIYLIYPIWMVRPDLSILGNGLSDSLVGMLWQVDNAANVFPSQHVVFVFIVGMMMALAFPKWCWLAYLYVFVVCVSIVLLKQHYVWDIFAGLLIGYVAYFLAFKREKLLI